ncbi:MAG TPA: phospholipid carrier-dependent glycosyltransferase, partial [Patescibacteria group bacterium]
YITHTDFYDSHPPLGKLIIAASITLFGNVPLGWRFFNAIAGILLLGVIYGFTKDLTKNRGIAVLALFLVAIEPMALVESRVGLINIYLALFSLAGLWFFWRWWDKPKHHISDYILALIFFAAAASVKWIGLGAIGAALAFLVLAGWMRTENRAKFNFWHIALLAIIPLLYIASFTVDLIQTRSPLLEHFIWWHKSTWNYHAHLDATHPYGSSWWSWAIMLRPIWLYYQSPTPGTILGIVEVGNIVTWIGGLIALFATMFTLGYDRKNLERNVFLILTYLALYLPWIFISRVKFIYHYFVPVLLLLILLATVTYERLLKKPEYRPIGIIFLTLGFAFFVYFLPLLMGLPLSDEWYRHHMWFRSWI